MSVYAGQGRVTDGIAPRSSLAHLVEHVHLGYGLTGARRSEHEHRWSPRTSATSRPSLGRLRRLARRPGASVDQRPPGPWSGGSVHRSVSCSSKRPPEHPMRVRSYATLSSAGGMSDSGTNRSWYCPGGSGPTDTVSGWLLSAVGLVKIAAAGDGIGV